MKFGNVVQVETSRYLTKIATLRRRPIVNSFRFLQLSIRLRYNYYVQLVAIKRDWMRVANLIFAEGGWKLVVLRAVAVQALELFLLEQFRFVRASNYRNYCILRARTGNTGARTG